MAKNEPSRVNDFRNYVPESGDGEIMSCNTNGKLLSNACAPDNPHLVMFDTSEPYEYSRQKLSTEPFKSMGIEWQKKASEPFFGITIDGMKKEDLFSLKDEGAPTSIAACFPQNPNTKIDWLIALQVEAATAVLDALSDEERSKVMCDLDDDKCRKWCNPEFVLFDVGIRIEHLSQHQKDLVMNLLKSSLSRDGFSKITGAIKTNAFLGLLCKIPAIMNESSYFFLISGSPSLTEPWGFTFFGHHLCLNFFFLDKQMVVSPCFIGAEPNVIDEGSDKGLAICVREEDSGLRLMQSLPIELQRRAQIYKDLHDDAMPPGRWNFADQRHLGGAFRDNQIIPYEGILASEMSADLQGHLMEVIKSYFEILPEPVLDARLKDIQQHFHETYFCWIGGFGDEDSFYYRVQNPVICVEFDHHAGIYLTNSDPRKYHIHTIIRTPNGNDYGRRLLKLYQETQHH